MSDRGDVDRAGLIQQKQKELNLAKALHLMLKNSSASKKEKTDNKELVARIENELSELQAGSEENPIDGLDNDDGDDGDEVYSDGGAQELSPADFKQVKIEPASSEEEETQHLKSETQDDGTTNETIVDGNDNKHQDGICVDATAARANH